MKKFIKILIISGELSGLAELRGVLPNYGMISVICSGIVEAEAILSVEHFDAVLIISHEVREPEMAFVARLKATQDNTAAGIITNHVSENSTGLLRLSGADFILPDAFSAADLKLKLADLNYSLAVSEPRVTSNLNAAQIDKRKFVTVAIGASTGGPAALIEILSKIPPGIKACFLIVQHGGPELIKMLAEKLGDATKMKVRISEDNLITKVGEVYIAPADSHLRLTSAGNIMLNRLPKENFVMPSIDHLFRSMGDAGSECSIAVLLTGQGADGAQGAAYASSAGCRLIVQSPESCEEPSMPESALNFSPKYTAIHLNEIAPAIIKSVAEIRKLTKKS